MPSPVNIFIALPLCSNCNPDSSDSVDSCIDGLNIPNPVIDSSCSIAAFHDTTLTIRSQPCLSDTLFSKPGMEHAS